MQRAVVVIILLILWLGAGVISAIVYVFLGDEWILQSTWRLYLWGAASAIVLYGIGWAFPGSPPAAAFHQSSSAGFGLIGLSILNGLCVGRLALNLVNSVGDSSPGELAEVAKVDWQHVGVVVRIAQPDRGAEFLCGKSKWGSVDSEGKRFYVHRGRLGLLWGEVR